jgi:tetratricopeptide (TPR) repeat protein
MNLLGKHEAGRESLREHLKTASEVSDIRALKYNLALSFIDQGQNEMGMKELEEIYALGKDQDNASRLAGVLTVMGHLYREMGNFKEAASKYQQAADLMENSDLSEQRKQNTRRIILYSHAQLALAQKDIKQAKAYTEKFKQSIQGVKDRIRTWNYHELLGLIALQEGKYDEALGELRRSNFPNPYIYLQMSIAAYKKGDRSQAIKFCERAAHFNGMNNLNYAFVRMKATQFLEKLRN